MRRQLIIIGIPIGIMLHIALQHFMNMSFIAPSRASSGRSFRSASGCISCGSPSSPRPASTSSAPQSSGSSSAHHHGHWDHLHRRVHARSPESKSEKKLHVSYSRDKLHRRERQQWNIPSVRFPQTRRPHLAHADGANGSLEIKTSVFSSLGTAVISFDPSSVAICGSTRANSRVFSKCDSKKVTSAVNELC
jgi:hypothetical protein